MSSLIHASAVIDPGAELAPDVEVGPYAVIGPRVVIGGGCVIGAGAQVRGPSRLGEGNRIYANACIGFDPQDLKFAGEETWLEVGDRNIFREFCTVHRGTGEGGGLTTVGSGNLFMAYTHVAHDCHVGDRTVFANSGTLAGHVDVHDDSTIGAFSSVHQGCRVGRHAYIGGYSVITRDPLPFAKTVGHKPACYGLNRVGLERKGFSKERLSCLETALRYLVRGGLNTAQALDRIRQEFPEDPDLLYMVSFIEGSQRGVIKNPPSKRGQRGAGDVD